MLSRTICTCGKFKYCEPSQCQGRFGLLESISVHNHSSGALILQTDVMSRIDECRDDFSKHFLVRQPISYAN